MVKGDSRCLYMNINAKTADRNLTNCAQCEMRIAPSHAKTVTVRIQKGCSQPATVPVMARLSPELTVPVAAAAVAGLVLDAGTNS